MPHGRKAFLVEVQPRDPGTAPGDAAGALISGETRGLGGLGELHARLEAGHTGGS